MFATCTGGTSVSSIEASLFENGVKWSAEEIYQDIYLNKICKYVFHVFEIQCAQAFKLNIYCSFNIDFYQGCPQTLAEICPNMGICDISGHRPPGKIYPGFILLPQLMFKIYIPYIALCPNGRVIICFCFFLSSMFYIYSTFELAALYITTRCELPCLKHGNSQRLFLIYYDITVPLMTLN